MSGGVVGRGAGGRGVDSSVPDSKGTDKPGNRYNRLLLTRKDVAIYTIGYN